MNVGDRLAQMLRERHLTAAEVQRRRGYHPKSAAVISDVLHGRTRRASTVRSILDAIAATSDERAGIEPLLAEWTGVVACVCQECGKERPSYLSPGARRSRARDDRGRYLVPCEACNGRRAGMLPTMDAGRRRATLSIMAKQYEREELSPRAAEAQAKSVMARRGDKRAKAEIASARRAHLAQYKAENVDALERLRQAGRQTPAARRRLSFSYWLTQRLAGLTRSKNHRVFSVCPLCTLVVFDATWHRWCSDAVRDPALRREASRRPRGRPRRRREVLTRDIVWLVAVKTRERLSELPLSPAARRRWKPRLLNRELLELVPRARRPTTLVAVEARASAVVRRLPGSWSVAFSRRTVTRDKRSPGDHYARVIANWNAAVPLPEVVRSLIDRGDRDPLIRRLYTFGMAPERIATITGATRERVGGIIRVGGIDQ